MFGLSPLPLYALVFLLCTNGIAIVLWRTTAGDLRELQLRGAIQAEETRRITKDQERITDETVEGWAAALAVVRRDYERRLRDAGTGKMPGISRPASGPDATAGNAIPAPERVAADCAEETLKLIYLQRWISAQKDANP